MNTYNHSDRISEFEQFLRREERSENTISKYLHDITIFLSRLGACELSKEAVGEFKEYLCALGRTPETVNSALAAVHSYLAFVGREDCRVRYLKRQRRLFRDSSRELSRDEYERLVRTAENRGNSRLALLFETICATGIRVSEVKYVTVEAVTAGQAEISLKGKIRTILIPTKLARKLRSYARQQKIASGAIFRTSSGRLLTRRQIWGDMKKICAAARVEAGKVFPHNLRHLFARAFYKASRDIVKLANLLGHSQIETTRIYLLTTSAEHTRELERLKLVL